MIPCVFCGCGNGDCKGMTRAYRERVDLALLGVKSTWTKAENKEIL